MRDTDLVTYEQAQRLRMLGYSWSCNHYYYRDTKKPTDVDVVDDWNASSNFISAPHVWDVLRWLRERKATIAEVHTVVRDSGCMISGWRAFALLLDGKRNEWVSPCLYSTYDAALSAAIDKALTILEENV